VGGYLLLGPLSAAVPYVLTLAGASFLYLALAGLIPLLARQSDRRQRIERIVLLVASAALAWLTGHHS
jgi:zinc and cadmium transporter